MSYDGDHATMLAVFRQYRGVRRRERRKWASDCFVNDRALRRALDVHDQLAGYLEASPNLELSAPKPPLRLNLTWCAAIFTSKICRYLGLALCLLP